MSSKSDTEVIIGGKVYTLSGYEGEDYLQRVAAYINNKINEFNDMEEVRRYPVDMEQELEIKEKEIYDLKHELISEQIKAETNDKNVKELERQNKELLLNKSRLESALEDALLGAVRSPKEMAAIDADDALEGLPWEEEPMGADSFLK